MNAVLDAIEQRYTCRHFLPTPVPAETLAAITQAGLHAPSAVDRQPWRIVCVTNPDAIADLEAAGLESLKTVDPAGYERILGRGGRLLYGAPAVLLLLQQPQPGAGVPADVDTGILASHLALAAQSLGVNSCIAALTGAAFKTADAAAREARLGFPEGFEFALSVLLGYESAEPKAPHAIDPSKILTVA